MTFPELATLAADPDRLQNVPPESIPRLIGEAETLRALLWARLQAPAPPVPATTRPSSESKDRNGAPDNLLKASEAAIRLGVNRRWMYRHADTLPFTRKLTEGTLRFSEKGLERWKESRG